MALKRLCVMAALPLIAAVSMAPNALAASKHVTLAPAGYQPSGNSTVVVAGGPGALVGPGDHVVICHAIGGANGDRFIQIAPSAGTVFGHDTHEGDRDIIPPFVYENGKGARNTSLASGNNWTPANSAIYANGCAAGGAGNETPPADVCPNIDGVQSAVPAGMVKDQAGNCVTPATAPQTQPLGPQTQPEAPQTQPQAPTARTEKTKTARKAKSARKAKTARKVRKTRRARNVRAKTHRRVKALRRAATKRPRVLPFTP
jgi:hypothetical protein